MGVRSIVRKIIMYSKIVNIFSHWVHAVDSSLVPFCRACACLQLIQGVCQMLGHSSRVNSLRQNKEKSTHKPRMGFEFN
jgi:K+-transporting ATPase A subunit